MQIMTLSQKNTQSVLNHVSEVVAAVSWVVPTAAVTEGGILKNDLISTQVPLEEETSNLEGTELLPKDLYSVPKLVQKNCHNIPSISLFIQCKKKKKITRYAFTAMRRETVCKARKQRSHLSQLVLWSKRLALFTKSIKVWSQHKVSIWKKTGIRYQKDVQTFKCNLIMYLKGSVLIQMNRFRTINIFFKLVSKINFSP